MSLAPWGIAARLLHTPGHTRGSLTHLGADGVALVGDLRMNALPFGLGPVYPPFAEDPSRTRRRSSRAGGGSSTPARE